MDEKKDNIVDVYSNALTVSNTYFDFNLVFRKEYMYEEEGQQKKDSEQVALVRVSPQLAKGLLALLQNNIREYEKQYGPIPNLK